MCNAVQKDVVEKKQRLEHKTDIVERITLFSPQLLDLHKYAQQKRDLGL